MPEQNPFALGYGGSSDNSVGNKMANIAWADWDDDGQPDLIIGNIEGRLFPRLNTKGKRNPEESVAPPPMASEPQFSAKYLQTETREIPIDGQPWVFEFPWPLFIDLQRYLSVSPAGAGL